MYDIISEFLVIYLPKLPKYFTHFIRVRSTHSQYHVYKVMSLIADDPLLLLVQLDYLYHPVRGLKYVDAYVLENLPSFVS